MELYKHYCVINDRNEYVDFVLADIDDNGDVVSVQYYTLQENESLIDAKPPVFKIHAESFGFSKPVWNGTEWVENATDAEIAEWNEANPAPEPVEPEPTEAEQLRADVDYLAIMTGVEL